MFPLIARIVFRSALTLFLLAACVFFGLHLTGDPARIMLGDGADAAAIEAFREQWGLNRPLWEQFFIYIGKFLQLDMGKSYLTGLPVKDVFLEALDATLHLMIPTAVVTLLIGIPSGVVAALYRNTWVDKTMMFVSVFGYAVPNFFMGVLLLLIFSITLGILPSYGNATVWHYIMPVITMATSEAAIFSRYARSAMIEALNLPCVKAARMRGESASSGSTPSRTPCSRSSRFWAFSSAPSLRAPSSRKTSSRGRAWASSSCSRSQTATFRSCR